MEDHTLKHVIVLADSAAPKMKSKRRTSGPVKNVKKGLGESCLCMWICRVAAYCPRLE